MSSPPAWLEAMAVYNIPMPSRAFKYCHCHNWRIDECPNIQVALVMKPLLDEAAR